MNERTDGQILYSGTISVILFTYLFTYLFGTKEFDLIGLDLIGHGRVR